MDDKQFLDTMIRVCEACAEMPTRERLDVLMFTWLSLASNARTEALILPGGFPAERARQVALLGKVAKLVASEEPDLEVERLYHEGDWEGIIGHIKRIQQEGGL